MLAQLSRNLLAMVLILGPTNGYAALTHLYLLDDGSGTVASDSIGTDHGTIKSAGGTGTWTTSGRFGGAWDGTASGFVSVPATNVSHDAGTFVQWVKISSSAANYTDALTTHIVDPDYDPYPMRQELTNSGTAQFWGIPDGDAGYNSIGTSVTVADDTWHQWTMTYDQTAGEFRAYIDGRPLGTRGYDNTNVLLNSTWLMGARFEDGNSRLSGVFDNTAVYDRALSQAEVWKLYRAAGNGVSLDSLPKVQSSGGQRHLYTFGAASHPDDDVVLDVRSGYDGYVGGGQWTADSPPKNTGAWNKNGSEDYVMLPMEIDLNQGTYQGWFKSDGASSNWSNPFGTAIRATDESHEWDSMRIEVTSSNTYLFGIPKSTTGDGILDTGVDTTDGQWHLLTVTYQDGSPVRLYIDDMLAGETTFNYDVNKAESRGYEVIGVRDLGRSGSWRGSVGTFSYYSTVLSGSDVADIYANGIHVPEPVSGVLLALGTLWLLPLRRRRGR